MTLNFYDCHNLCRPEKNQVGAYWELYQCGAWCAGVGIPLIYVYMHYSLYLLLHIYIYTYSSFQNIFISNIYFQKSNTPSAETRCAAGRPTNARKMTSIATPPVTRTRRAFKRTRFAGPLTIECMARGSTPTTPCPGNTSNARCSADLRKEIITIMWCTGAKWKNARESYLINNDYNKRAVFFCFLR